jgi:predicted  nucleic acid-binding Zn-ribbon protein
MVDEKFCEIMRTELKAEIKAVEKRTDTKFMEIKEYIGEVTKTLRTLETLAERSIWIIEQSDKQRAETNEKIEQYHIETRNDIKKHENLIQAINMLPMKKYKAVIAWIAGVSGTVFAGAVLWMVYSIFERVQQII